MNEMQGKKFCTKCGTENDVNSRFCNKCGENIENVFSAGNYTQNDFNGNPMPTNAGYGTSTVSGGAIGINKNVLIIGGVVLVVVVLLIAMVASLFSSKVDSRIVGKWRSDDGAVFVCKRNGTFIGNPGESDEKTGKCKTEDGVIYVTIRGETVERRYRVVSSNCIEVENDYLTSSWQWKTKWVEYWKIG